MKFTPICVFYSDLPSLNNENQASVNDFLSVRSLE